MRDQSRLDLGRRDIDTTDLQHVVGAAGVDIIAVFVAAILVAAQRPLPLERPFAALNVIPVVLGAGWPRDLQLADLALPGGSPLVVDQAHVIAGDRLAGRAVAHVAGPIRQEDMQHLGRPYPIENIDPEALGPASPDIKRQCFASRHTSA